MLVLFFECCHHPTWTWELVSPVQMTPCHSPYRPPLERPQLDHKVRVAPCDQKGKVYQLPNCVSCNHKMYLTTNIMYWHQNHRTPQYGKCLTKLSFRKVLYVIFAVACRPLCIHRLDITFSPSFPRV